ncbi:MAG: hypothetical protein CM15mP49_33030 [Actinomycetota bacterium]|nr:MAG: hypothetical protein CM15mP49_33030 [Actinomycetota bacterium]
MDDIYDDRSALQHALRHGIYQTLLENALGCQISIIIPRGFALGDSIRNRLPFHYGTGPEITFPPVPGSVGSRPPAE